MKFSFERVKTALDLFFFRAINKFMGDVEENFKETTARIDNIIVNASTQEIQANDARLDLQGTLHGSLKTRIDSDALKVLSKADLSYVETILAAAVSGAPKGVYTTLNALKAAYPEGTVGVFLVLENGHIYVWNGASWADAGAYQGVEVGDGSITPKKTSFLKLDKTKNLFGGVYTKGYLSGVSGSLTLTSDNGKIAIIPISPSTKYSVTLPSDASTLLKLATSSALVSTGGTFDGAVNLNVGLKETVITTGPNDKYLYASVVAVDNPTSPYLKVLPSSTIISVIPGEIYPYGPEGVEIYKKSETYSKSEVDTKITKVDTKTITPASTSFFKLDTAKNLFDGNLKKMYLQGNADGTLYLYDADALVGLVAVKPNTSYSIGVSKDVPTRLKVGTSTKTMNLGETLDGSVAINIGTTIKTQVITTGANDKYMYINVVSLGATQTPYLKVVESATPVEVGTTEKNYPFNPNGINVYSREQVDTLIANNSGGGSSVSLPKLKVEKTGESLILRIPSPRSKRYTSYTFSRNTNPSKNLDIWRIMDISILDGSFTQLYTLCNAYDADGVVKISGQADYIGGYHGYETMDSMTLLIDGKAKDTTNDFTTLDAQSAKIIVKSTVYNNGTTTKAFDKFKVLTFTTSGLDIYSKYVATASTRIDVGRLTLLSIEKTSGSTTLIDKYVENFTFVPTALPVNGTDGATLVYDTLIDQIEFTGPEIYAKLQRLNKSTLSGHRGSVVDFTTRMKGYIDCVRSYDIAAGQYIENTARYEVYS